MQNALATRLYVMTNTTLLRHNAPFLAETLDFLAETGGADRRPERADLFRSRAGRRYWPARTELPPLLELARAETTDAGQKLIWYTPTQYCHFDPLQMDLGVKGCTAALYNMCVEPDGSVCPANLITSRLVICCSTRGSTIWNHELASGCASGAICRWTARPAPCWLNVAAAARWRARQTRISDPRLFTHLQPVYGRFHERELVMNPSSTTHAKRFFPPIEPLPAGDRTNTRRRRMRHIPYRLHLRIEPDGSGLLIVNASTVVHLNHTAAEYAYHLVIEYQMKNRPSRRCPAL